MAFGHHPVSQSRLIFCGRTTQGADTITSKSSRMRNEQLIDQAADRYVRWCRQTGSAVEHPSSYKSEVSNDRVILRNCNGVLAVYSVECDRLGHKLKRPIWDWLGRFFISECPRKVAPRRRPWVSRWDMLSILDILCQDEFRSDYAYMVPASVLRERAVSRGMNERVFAETLRVMVSRHWIGRGTMIFVRPAGKRAIEAQRNSYCGDAGTLAA